MTDQGTGLRTMLAILQEGMKAAMEMETAMARVSAALQMRPGDAKLAIQRLASLSRQSPNQAADALLHRFHVWGVKPDPWSNFPQWINRGVGMSWKAAPTPTQNARPGLPGVAQMAVTPLTGYTTHPVLPHSGEQKESTHVYRLPR